MKSSREQQPPELKPSMRACPAASSAKSWLPKQIWRPGEQEGREDALGKNKAETTTGNTAAPDVGGNLKLPRMGYSPTAPGKPPLLPSNKRKSGAEIVFLATAGSGSK